MASYTGGSQPHCRMSRCTGVTGPLRPPPLPAQLPLPCPQDMLQPVKDSLPLHRDRPALRLCDQLQQSSILGAGVLRKFGADFFCVFFLASIFQTNGMFKQVFCAEFWCADFSAHFCAHFWCADFCAHFCADFWCTDFCAHFRAHFPQIFLRHFGA